MCCVDQRTTCRGQFCLYYGHPETTQVYAFILYVAVCVYDWGCGKKHIHTTAKYVEGNLWELVFSFCPVGLIRFSSRCLWPMSHLDGPVFILFICFYKTVPSYVAQAGLKTCGNPPASVPQMLGQVYMPPCPAIVILHLEEANSITPVLSVVSTNPLSALGGLRYQPSPWFPWIGDDTHTHTHTHTF